MELDAVGVKLFPTCGSAVRALSFARLFAEKLCFSGRATS